MYTDIYAHINIELLSILCSGRCAWLLLHILAQFISVFMCISNFVSELKFKEITSMS